MQLTSILRTAGIDQSRTRVLRGSRARHNPPSPQLIDRKSTKELPTTVLEVDLLPTDQRTSRAPPNVSLPCQDTPYPATRSP